MDALVEKATAHLTVAKDEYQLKLRQIDNVLQAAVGDDAASLGDAQTIQGDYDAGITPTTLVEALQP